MDEIISYKMCAVKVLNAKLRNYLKIPKHSAQTISKIYPGCWGKPCYSF